jgi:hypothetical protein
LRSPGQPLDAASRAYFEPRFGLDFSGVRIHSDARAAASAADVHSLAYTFGKNIVFRSGFYAPGTLEGRRLIAHELAHVVQQGHGTDKVRRQPDKDDEDDIEMPAEYVGRGSLCAGRPCFNNEKFEADLNRSRAEDVAAENKATAERKRRLDIKRHGSKQQKWEVEFLEDPRVLKDVGAVVGTRDDGIMTPRGIRVPKYIGDYLSPRPFYERRSAAMFAWQGYIHLAEIVESGQDAAATNLINANRGALIKDSDLDLRGFTHWSEKAHDARDKAMVLATIAEGGAANAGAAADLIAQRAASTFATEFGALLGRPAVGRGAEMTVEGVGMSGVRVNVRNGELVASYDTIVNVSRIPNQGKAIQRAFEAGAVQAARNAGLNSARVAVETIQNKVWEAYLKSNGYGWASLELRKRQYSTVLTKVFPL